MKRSYSRRELYALGEPLGDSATYRKADGLVLGDGGGGGSSGSGNVTQTNTSMTELPEWARGYAKDTLYQASQLTDLTKNPYQTYGQNRIAGFSPMQEQAQQGAANMQPNAALGTGTDMATAAGIGALGTNYQAGQYGNQFQAPQNLGYNANTFQANQMGPVRDVSASGYGAPTMNAAQTGYNPQLKNYQMGPAERVNTQSFAQPGSADAYMSPYMQNVVDIQKREAQRQSGIQGTQQQAQAAQAGAFGGGRDAIMRAERERNLSQQMGDIQATGSQAAYQQAQQQFNAEQQARLVAQQANQQAGITTGSQNLAAKLGVQQLGAGQIGLQTSLANLSNVQQQQVQNQAAQLQTQGMNAQQAMQAALANQQRDISVGGQNLGAAQQTSLANQNAQNQAQQFGAGQGLQAAGMGAQYGLAGQQLGEQSRQYGAGLGLQGLQTGLQAAGQLGQLGQAQYGQQMGINQLQNQYGGQQQALAQQGLSQGYQDFLNQQNYPYKQLGFMSDMVRGLPLGQQSTAQIYQAPPSMMQNIGAAGMGAYGLSKLMAKGGQVKSYASGGELNPMNDINRMTAAVNKLSDEQLKQIVQRPSSAAQKQAAELELATRASEKQGLASAYNALPAGAGGGMVAFGKGGIMHFQTAGEVNDPYAVDSDFAETGVEMGNQVPETMGNAALRAKINPLLLKAAQRMGDEQEFTADSETEEQGITRNMAMMNRIAGPSSYDESKAQVADLTSQAKDALEQGKGIAALSAMGAILQGPNFMRALGGAGTAFADSYKGALTANQAAKTSIAQMNINLAAGQRAEKLGLIKDAAGSYQAAKKYRLDAFKAQQLANSQALTALSKAEKAVQPPKPVAAPKPSVQSEGVAIYVKSLMAKDPTLSEDEANALALTQYNRERAAGLPGVEAAVAGRADVAGNAQELEWAKAVNTEVDKRISAIQISDYGRDPEYRKDPIKFKIDLAKRIRAGVLADPNFKKPGAGAAAAAPAPTTRLKFDAKGNQIQ